jgi:hypothetical protein
LIPALLLASLLSGHARARAGLGSLQLLHGSQNTAELLELVEKNCKEEFRGKLILLVKNVTSLIKIKLGTALENEPCKFFYFLAILK